MDGPTLRAAVVVLAVALVGLTGFAARRRAPWTLLATALVTLWAAGRRRRRHHADVRPHHLNAQVC
jgi:hypothetical protein